MNSQKHTPGPWTLDAFEDYVDGTDMEVLDGHNFPIAEVEASPILNRWNKRFPEMGHWADGADDGRTHIHRSQQELLANARLIAAAPDMLAALKQVRARLQEYRLYGDAAAAFDLAEKAIAKAEGSTPQP